MNDSIDFTIIIPAKNEESNIGNCLASIFATNFDRNRYEVLVVDNGSEDQTVQIAKNMGANVFEKPGLTISGLRNFGARQANGKILVFLDADCTVDLNWLAAASIYLEQDVVSFGSPAILPENSTWVQRTWFNIRGKKTQVEEVDWLESANVFVREDAFRTVGGFNEDLITCEDYDLSTRLKKLGQLLVDSRIVAIHHREPGTIREFFRKEKWRGKSNFEGISSHGFRLKELPSLGIPLIHFSFVGIVLMYLIYGALFSIEAYWVKLVAFLLVWQLPFIFLSAWKIRYKISALTVLQLFFLLNVYFFARGCALFGGGRR